MTRPILCLALLAAAPAQAGFIPAGASDVHKLPGAVAYSLGGVDHLRLHDRGALARRIASATRYARTHSGDLPASAFWVLTASIYREDVALFKAEHACKPLLALLRRDLAHAGPQPLAPTQPPVAPPGVGPPCYVRPPGRPGPQVVPEPASWVDVAIGSGLVLAGMAAMGSRKGVRP